MNNSIELESTVKVLSRIMETTSICGLGQVASNPLKSYLRYFWQQPELSRSVE
ncbi:MAG TPA: NADH-ubiquinone oxidoreductase-F iron-sulfur binding region domain-containing protein [Pirellula sp.]|nr:NADH-ubiquinone oxidoreductase-F iron-sulfur binding region domain-containing protein [Pirellula sp.]